MKLSVVIPAYNEEGALAELIARVRRVLEAMPAEWEAIVVDDGSTDATWEVLEAASRDDDRIRGIRLSRNFGHQIALTAGLSATTGDLVITMDADLQHPPESIPALVMKANEGFDVVYAVRGPLGCRGKVQDQLGAPLLSHRQLAHLAGPARRGCRLQADVASRGRRPSPHARAPPLSRGMTRWVGFPQATVEYERDVRFGGSSKYTKRAMVGLASTQSWASPPCPFASPACSGLLLSFLGGLYFLYVIGVRLLTDAAVQGWTSVVGVVLVLGGVQLACIGIIGQYLGRMYDELKSRPLFVVRADTHEGALLPRDPDRPEPQPAAPL